MHILCVCTVAICWDECLLRRPAAQMVCVISRGVSFGGTCKSCINFADIFNCEYCACSCKYWCCKACLVVLKTVVHVFHYRVYIYISTSAVFIVLYGDLLFVNYWPFISAIFGYCVCTLTIFVQIWPFLAIWFCLFRSFYCVYIGNYM